MQLSNWKVRTRCCGKSRAGVSPAHRVRQREQCAGFAGGAGETPALRWLASVWIGRYLTALVLGLICPRGDLRAQHLHLNAGALAITNGAPLHFVNGDSFVADSGFVFSSVLRSNGPTSGYYSAGLTFTSVVGDGFDGPPAAPGAQVALVVKSVSGPEGGSWAFWDSLDTNGDQKGDCDEEGERFTFNLSVGATNGTNRFVLSQNNGLPGEDPYGHCHGRLLTMNRPGLYTVGVQLIDVSRNGPGGGPIHTPSQIYQIHFQAGVTIARLERTNNSTVATFATLPSNAARQFSYFLESSASLDNPGAWETVAGPLRGNNRLQSLSDPMAITEDKRFYRLRVTSP